MPLPTPHSDEERSEFMQRCMSDEVAKRDFKDTQQRVAVCFSQWRKKHPGDKPPEK
jgi:hypothetical protein